MSRPSKLASHSVADLRREMARRQRRGQTMLRRRARLAAKLNAMDATIAELGLLSHGALNGSLAGRRRPRNEMKLVDALVKVLHGKSMRVTDVTEAVQKAGYKTTSPSFRTIVNQALLASGKFKRVERGVYTAK